MENRKDRPSMAAPLRKKNRARPFLIVSGIAVLAVAALVGGYLLTETQEPAFDNDRSQTHPVATTHEAAPVAQPEPEASASVPDLPVAAAPPVPDVAPAAPAGTPATIVLDDDAPGGETNPFDGSATPAAAGTAPGGTAPTATVAAAAPIAAAAAATATASTARGNPFAAAPAAAAPAKREAAAARKPAKAASEKDLMAMLLNNIEESQKGKTPSSLKRPESGSDQDALEELVRQISAQDAAKSAAAGNAAKGTKTAKVAPTPARKAPAAAPAAPAKNATARSDDAAPSNLSDVIQSSLRNCPKANTTKGLQCRQQVCSKYAGLDPACPAQ